MVNKKLLVGFSILLIAGLAFAITFNEQVKIEFNGNQCLVVKEQFGPKVFGWIDCVAGGKWHLTSIVPTGAPNESLGEPGNEWPAIYGQLDTINATLGHSCTKLCDNLDGYPTAANWSCVNAFYTDGTGTTCADTGRMRNCVCSNS